jgi:hypothetical protein
MTSDIEKETTSCFTYEVTMVLQVIAKSQEEADARLDQNGGFISKRDVSLKNVVELYSEDVRTKTKSKKGY